VADEQGGGREAQQELCGLTDMHLEPATFIDGEQCEAHMDDDRGQDQQIRNGVLPDDLEDAVSCLQCVQRNQAQRVVQQMCEDKGKQHKPGAQPKPPFGDANAKISCGSRGFPRNRLLGGCHGIERLVFVPI